MSAPILIFGATGGVGSALARRLAEAGHSLALSGRNENALHSLADDLGATAHPGDVLDDDARAGIINAACSDDGGLAGLAFCVGSIDLKPLKRVGADDLLNAFRLNSLAAALAVQQAAPALKKAKGSVVLFSTIAVQQGFPNHAIVASAKGAVEGLGRALAADLAPDIRVNVVAPSLMKTNMAAPIVSSDAMAEGIAKLHPIPRLGEAADAANLAAFLLSPDSPWITGQVMRVDGGRSHLRTRG
ncbi:SDR family NAD(P)-dependent oxidoreductase [Pyruvatibacter mobilis]|jgi:NAD(P)-dependent dehydrogenase (short-subunit alcohol dehydrogenase family)|uniref:SDR family NAD(P)-dependent oxidoreductase n=1 Tax=Pyruvatibacter mobilis TaxID=1712261 RepID=UPI003C79CC4A